MIILGILGGAAALLAAALAVGTYRRSTRTLAELDQARHSAETTLAGEQAAMPR